MSSRVSRQIHEQEMLTSSSSQPDRFNNSLTLSGLRMGSLLVMLEGERLGSGPPRSPGLVKAPIWLDTLARSSWRLAKPTSLPEMKCL